MTNRHPTKKSAAQRTIEGLQDKSERDSIDSQRHISAVQAEVARWRLLANVDIRLLAAQFGPVLWDMLIVARAGVDAADPTRGAPGEDTARVSQPSSERREGLSTQQHRKTLEAFKRKLGRLVADFAMQLGTELPDHRGFSAHTRHHLETGEPTSGCDYCLLDPRMQCENEVRGERCDGVKLPNETVCRKHLEAA